MQRHTKSFTDSQECQMNNISSSAYENVAVVFEPAHCSVSDTVSNQT